MTPLPASSSVNRASSISTACFSSSPRHHVDVSWTRTCCLNLQLPPPLPTSIPLNSIHWYLSLWNKIDNGTLPVTTFQRFLTESERKFRDFPGGPVTKTLHSQCRGPGSIPGPETRSHMPQLRVCVPQRKDLAYHNQDLEQPKYILKILFKKEKKIETFNYNPKALCDLVPCSQPSLSSSMYRWPSHSSHTGLSCIHEHVEHRLFFLQRPPRAWLLPSFWLSSKVAC